MSSSTPPNGEATPSPVADTPVETPISSPVVTPTNEGEPAPQTTTPDAEASAAPATADAGQPQQAAREGGRVDVQAVASELKQLFPALFGGPAKPLKLRVQADIQQRAPGKFSKQQLSAFLRRYTGGTGYLISLTKAKQRFDLDGQPAGELSDEHRQAAQEELTRRRGITETRRAEEDKVRNDRAQLLRDFSRTTLTPANFSALKGMTPEQLDAQLALAREEAAQQPPRPERDERPRRGGDRPGERHGRPGGREGQGERRHDGPRPPRREGQGRPDGGGRRPPKRNG